MRIAGWLAILGGGGAAAAAEGLDAGQPPAVTERTREPAEPGPAADPVERRVLERLRRGRLDAATAELHRALGERPHDPAVREQFIAFHVSLARALIDEQQYAAAERAARAALTVDAGHAAAQRLVDLIAGARRDAPRRAREALELIALEMFEPAQVTLAQAVALVEKPPPQWLDGLHAATLGAADDHFICGNHASAFSFYDALPGSGRPMAAPLRERRWISLALGLADAGATAERPAAFWAAIAAQADDNDPAGAGFRELLRGLAAEAAQETAQAAPLFRAAARAMGGNAEGLPAAAARRVAIDAVRRRADPRQIQRSVRRATNAQPPRGGAKGDAPASRHFEIAATAPDVTPRCPPGLMLDALEYHFDRVTRYLGENPAALAWPARCALHIHADDAALQAATRRPGATRAVSIIRARGGVLVEHSLHVTASDPLLLSATIPHELAHLIAAAATGYRPMPPVVSEGLALQFEPRCRAEQFERVLVRAGGPRPLAELLDIGAINGAEESRLYAEGMHHVARLLQRMTPRELLRTATSEPRGLVR